MNESKPGAPPLPRVTPRPVIISLHGIRTAGAWQKALATPIAAAGGIPVPLDFGYFGAVRLVTKCERERRVKWLRDEIERVRSRYDESPLSIVAHSFGSYITAALLESHPSVCFETVIFSGSIVRRDFPWAALLDSRRVGFLANYVGRQDIWPRAARWFVGGAGDSGSVGFDDQHPALYQHYSAQYAHSDYFNPVHFEHFWLPTLIYPQRAMLDHLGWLVDGVLALTRASAVLREHKVRSRLFVNHPARPGHYWTMPGIFVSETEAAFTAQELDYVLSLEHARALPDQLPPALSAIGRDTAVTWTGPGQAVGQSLRVVAAAACSIERTRTSGAPIGLLSLELLSRESAQEAKLALDDLLAEAVVLMRAQLVSLAVALERGSV